MNSNLVFILLLLFAAALIVFAVLPPLRRWQRDREWEEFGTDLDIGGAIAGRIDGVPSGAVVGQERLEARADPTGGQDGERTQTDIALEELKRLERLNLSLDDEFDAFEEYLSGRRQERARHGGPGQSLRGIEGRPRRDLPGHELRDDRPEHDRPAEVDRLADLAQAAQLDAPADDRRVAVDAEPANGHHSATANGLTTANHRGGTGPGMNAGINPGDTAEDLVRAAGGQPGGYDDQPDARQRPVDAEVGPQTPPRVPAVENGRESYDWKAAAQYERARAARAGGPGRPYPADADSAHPGDAVRAPADAAPSTPPFGMDAAGRIIDRRDPAARPPGPDRRQPRDPAADQPAARHGWPAPEESSQPQGRGIPQVHVVEPPPQDAELPTVHVVEPHGHGREQPRVRVVEPSAEQPATRGGGVHQQPHASQASYGGVQVVEPQPRPDEPPAVYAVGPPSGAQPGQPSQPPQAPQAHGGGYAATPPGGAPAPNAPAAPPHNPSAEHLPPAGQPATLPDPPFMDPQPAAGSATALQVAGPQLPELPPVLSEDEINDLRSRWLEIKASFPDDPITAVREAKQLVNECTDLLAERLEVRRDQGEVSTEDLRLALRRYVAFYERLLWA